MKSQFIKLNAQQHYRFIVFIRVLLASLAGFVVANLTVATVALLFPKQLALATYTGFLLSFIIWLIFIVAIFSIKKTKHTIFLSLILILGLGLIVSLLKMWGSV